MRINADFDQRVVMHADEIEWLSSPMAGVERRPLDRIGGEVARATTIVRFAPESQFSPHIHDGGEEFLVLDGVFSDEHGDFPKGSYIRNPPTSSHTPSSKPGTTIFVKLWQFDPADRTHVRTQLDKIKPEPAANRPGIAVIPLFHDAKETVSVEVWQTGTQAEIGTQGGAELFVLDGTARAGSDELRCHSWLRVPDGEILSLQAGEGGVRFWLKTGHLKHITLPPGNS